MFFKVNNYNLRISFTNSGTHKLKKKNSRRAPVINSRFVLCICYVTVFCSLLTEKTLQSTQNIQENHRGGHLDKECIHMYTRARVPKINDFIICIKQDQTSVFLFKFN